MQNVAVVPAVQATVNAYAPVTGAEIDTAARRATSLGFRVEEVGDANGITAKVEASLDGTNYVDVVAYDEAGVVHASAGMTVAANAVRYFMVAPGAANGVKSAFRYYRVSVKSTVADTPGTAQVRGFAK